MMVIRYKETFCGMENWCYGVWKLSDNPTLSRITSSGNVAKRKIKQVTKKEAMRIIKEEGLVVALRCEDGVVWDTPDKAYYNKWKGFKFPPNF